MHVVAMCYAYIYCINLYKDVLYTQYIYIVPPSVHIYLSVTKNLLSRNLKFKMLKRLMQLENSDFHLTENLIII